ncbi:MAG: CaiB/BaiF CoA-transferase family protein [Pseudomonadota bacterium]
MEQQSVGPLSGFRVVEMAGIGPCPLAGQILGDLGADVIIIDRPGGDPNWAMDNDVTRRNKRSVTLNLKSEHGKAAALKLIETADVLIEGFRPGVMERLGLGPGDCAATNERLVYGRMTGWGQTGPLASVAGHDINYIALTGALHAMGDRDRPPTPPLNLIGDYGGGAMFLITGVLAALLESKNSGRGQVIDTAMTEGTSILAGIFSTYRANKFWNDERSSNFVDGGAHLYGAYTTKDGKFVTIGSLEPQFYAELLEKLELPPELAETRLDQTTWPGMRKRLEAVFRGKTRDEWVEILEGTDVCFAPALTFAEAPEHPQNVAREAYVDVEGVVQPSPAPRFSRTPGAVRHGARPVGHDTATVLGEIGLSDEEIGKATQ